MTAAIIKQGQIRLRHKKAYWTINDSLIMKYKSSMYIKMGIHKEKSNCFFWLLLLIIPVVKNTIY